MDKQALITVIVPVYNTAKYLTKCVDSILSQTWANLEIFLVDDGSTDDSANIIKDYQQRYPEVIKTIFQENSGQGSARNAALDVMSGDFVAFVDSDDWILPDMLTAMYQNLVETNSDVVTCNYQTVNDLGEITGLHSCGEICEQGQNIKDDYSLVFVLEAHVTSKLFKSSLFSNSYRFPVGIWYEDLAILPSVLSSCQRISKVPKYFYQYFKRDGTTTTTYSLKVLDALLATDHIEKLFKAEKKFQIYKDYIFSYQHRIFYLTSLRIALNDGSTERKRGYKILEQYLDRHKYLLFMRDYFIKDVFITKAVIFVVFLRAGRTIHVLASMKKWLRNFLK